MIFLQVIYTVFNPEFRKAFKKILGMGPWKTTLRLRRKPNWKPEIKIAQMDYLSKVLRYARAWRVPRISFKMSESMQLEFVVGKVLA